MRKYFSSSTTAILARIGNWLLIAILVLLPFHAFFTTWAGNEFGHFDLIRAWKELLLLIGVLIALGVVVSDRQKKWQRLLRSTPVLLAGMYVCLVLVVTAFTLANNSVTREALVYGLMIQLRLFCAAGLGALFALYDNSLYRRWWRVLAWPALIVVAFGLLQVFVLPHDFLEHFGYGPDTLPAFQTIDNKLAFERVQSTMRGANPLGAYLVIVITAAAVRIWQNRRDKLAGVLLAGSVPVLFFTYSRSAWIGLMLSGMVLAVVYGRSLITRRRLAVLSIIAALGIGGVWLLRDNDLVQNVVFHSDETSTSEISSNVQRGNALTRALGDIADQPLGGGVGSAGPASFRNEPAGPRISENYFLQTGQELGWMGLVGFVAVVLALVRQLWKQRSNTLATILLGSLVGLTFINFVLHAWADDVLSLLWWALAGTVIAHGILNEERTNESKTKKRTNTNR